VGVASLIVRSFVHLLRCVTGSPRAGRPAIEETPPVTVPEEYDPEVPEVPVDEEVPPMSDTESDPFCGSYYDNAIAYGSGGGDTSSMMPEGWSTPGDSETRTSTIRRNAVEGLWLPLFIPEGCQGHKGDVDPETGDVRRHALDDREEHRQGKNADEHH
jgi:hypothetical protein